MTLQLSGTFLCCKLIKFYVVSLVGKNEPKRGRVPKAPIIHKKTETRTAFLKSCKLHCMHLDNFVSNGQAPCI